MEKKHISGILIFIGSFVFSISIMIAEALKSSYSINSNYISDLGVGTNAWLFNYTVILFGVTMVVGALLLVSVKKRSVFPYLLILVGVGAMMVGLFPENTGSLHGIGASIAFIFAGLSAIAYVTWTKSSFRYASVIIGIIILASIFFFEEGKDLGIGAGGMERMIVYPGLLWGIALSVSLMSE